MVDSDALVMPVLVLNLGGEMIYILRQRLIAQKIHGSKAQKVLDDMLREICAEGFIDTLFLPQEVHPMKSVRKSFDRLAHCSTMKLNQSSMDRLFMLMVMVFKYQLLMCKCPREIIEVMLNHVTGMLNTAGTPELASMLTKCSEKIQAVYKNMSLEAVIYTRRTLCTLFQDHKVRTTILNTSHQCMDGSVRMPDTGVLPAGALLPGTVRYFAKGSEVRRNRLEVVNCSKWCEPSPDETSDLGSNLYGNPDADSILIILYKVQTDGPNFDVSCCNMGGEEIAVVAHKSLHEVRVHLAQCLAVPPETIKFLLADGTLLQQLDGSLEWILCSDSTECYKDLSSTCVWLKKGTSESLSKASLGMELSTISMLPPPHTEPARNKRSRACIIL